MSDFSDHVDSPTNNQVWSKNRDFCKKMFMYLHAFNVFQLFLIYFQRTLEYIMKRIGNMIFPQVFKQWWEHVDLYTMLEEGLEELTDERYVEALKKKKEPTGKKGTRSSQANRQ